MSTVNLTAEEARNLLIEATGGLGALAKECDVPLDGSPVYASKEVKFLAKTADHQATRAFMELFGQNFDPCLAVGSLPSNTRITFQCEGGGTAEVELERSSRARDRLAYTATLSIDLRNFDDATIERLREALGDVGDYSVAQLRKEEIICIKGTDSNYVVRLLNVLSGNEMQNGHGKMGGNDLPPDQGFDIRGRG